MLTFLYFIISSIFFDEDGFRHSRLNELIYYVVTLLPPFLYCWMEHLRCKREGDKKNARIYLSAGIVYLIGGFFSMLLLTNFYFLGKWSH